MKNKFSFLLSILACLSVMTATLYSCKKDKVPVANNEVAFFATPATTGIYTIDAASVVYKIPVGLTKIPAGSRTVTISVASPSGAASGTQYALDKTSVTFTPEHISDTIVVTGTYAEYLAGRKDTLKFSFTNASDGIPTLKNTFTLYMRGPCFEGGVILDDFAGAWKATEKLGTDPAYGPYATTISAITPTGPTTGTITVNNIWNNGWGPITFSLDWTDAANRTAIPVAQAAIPGSDAADVGYSGTFAVRPFAGQPGTFSWCNGTLTLKMQLGVTGLGYFTDLYTVSMVR